MAQGLHRPLTENNGPVVVGVDGLDGSYARVEMITRREAAVRLDIPPEMALRNGIPARVSEAEVARLDADPPPWLAQSRANRTGRKPVWVELTCDICGRSEMVRPKKWWPDFTYVSCQTHSPDDLPGVAAGFVRREYHGIGVRSVGLVDEPVDQSD